MSDLFHPDIPDDYVAQVVRVMEVADWHTYQVLTKRADRLATLLNSKLKHAASLEHIWWGVSVEDRKYGLPRVDHLRSTPAAMKFLSVEPLLEQLGPMNLQGINWVIVGGESLGLLDGARPLDLTGCSIFVISAKRLTSPSSSNNGAACGRKLLAVPSKAKPTMITLGL